MDRVSDETLEILRQYSADSFLSAPPPFLSVSGDILYEIVTELQERRSNKEGGKS